MYSVALAWPLILPSSTLNNSKKLESSVDDKVFLANVKSILNLWAPGALTFELPVALSFRVASSLEVTNDSVIVKPILYDGEFVYLSNTKVSSSHCTKKPFM